MKKQFELLADYNRWMNQKLYDAAAKLSETQLKRDQGAFFGSVIGTLNHVLVGDIIWLKRFAEHKSTLRSLDSIREIQNPSSLDLTLYPEFESLRQARSSLDDIILSFSSELTDELLRSALHYQSMNGSSFVKPFSLIVQHFFNHQTHHRGQVTTLLSQQGVDVGATDLLLRIPDFK